MYNLKERSTLHPIKNLPEYFNESLLFYSRRDGKVTDL